tara:strand:- start:630 stop:1763 length:1134 start_codon:yes stop_codon:yes gene_type:complete
MQINISTKAAYSIVLVFVVLIVSVIVVAVATPNGHEASQLDLAPITIGGNNVGIGTTSPDHAFQVNNEGIVIDTFNALSDINPRDSGIWVTDGQSGGLRPSENNHLVLQARSSVGREIIFVTGETPTERMTIHDNGNVGIGITSPGYKFHVLTQNEDDFAARIENNHGEGRGLLIVGGESPSMNSLRIDARPSTDGTRKSIFQVRGDGKVTIGSATSLGRLLINTRDNTNWAVDIANGGGSGKGLRIRAAASSTTPIFSAFTHGGDRRFEVRANGDIVRGSGSVLHSSDLRLKKNIETLEGALGKVERLRGVSFEWKEGNPGTQYGFIAQEVEEVLPDLILTDEETGLKHMSSEELIPILLESIKELSAKVEQLEKN